MPDDAIEFDPVDTISAGAIGIPGQRRFMIQATKDGAVLAVLLEKEQVALFATEAGTFLDNIATGEGGLDAVNDALCGQVADVEPLFRARVIGIGYDPSRELVLIELRETPPPDDSEAEPDPSEPEGMVARLYATRAQVRAVTRHGAAAVERGRPPCPLCHGPMDPEGHVCPRWN
jgi:uncharacterized repeat protein (TIGR03847 family)